MDNLTSELSSTKLLFEASQVRSLRADPNSGRILATDSNGSEYTFAEMRGWGHLTGSAARALSDEAAASIQDAGQKLIVESVNIVSRLRAALEVAIEQRDYLRFLGKGYAFESQTKISADNAAILAALRGEP